jgi:hypothetical protein
MEAHMTASTPSRAIDIGIHVRRARAIAKFYVAYGAGLIIAAVFFQPTIGSIQVQPIDAFGPGAMLLGAVALLRGFRVGFYATFFFSLIMLIAVPVGTVLGGFMIHSLWRARAHFAGRASAP